MATVAEKVRVSESDLAVSLQRVMCAAIGDGESCKTLSARDKI